MSRPRYYWYQYIKELLKRYPDALEWDNSRQATVALWAIKKAEDQTLLLPDGSERMNLINLVYFKGTHSIDGAAMKCHISSRTAQRWISSFIYAVARLMGFM